MSKLTSREICLASRPSGIPTAANFELVWTAPSDRGSQTLGPRLVGATVTRVVTPGSGWEKIPPAPETEFLTTDPQAYFYLSPDGPSRGRDGPRRVVQSPGRYCEVGETGSCVIQAGGAGRPGRRFGQLERLASSRAAGSLDAG